MNEYIEDNNGSKYLTLILIDEKYGKLLNKSEYLIKSEKKTNDYEKIYENQIQFRWWFTLKKTKR